MRRAALVTALLLASASSTSAASLSLDNVIAQGSQSFTLPFGDSVPRIQIVFGDGWLEPRY